MQTFRIWCKAALWCLPWFTLQCNKN